MQGESGEAVLPGREIVTQRRSRETLVSDRRQRALILPRLRCRVAGPAVGSDVEQPAHGEVVHQSPLVGIHDDAAGCQGSVGHAAAMRVVQRARDLLEDPHTGRELERSTGLQQGRERPAVHVLGGAPHEVLRGAVPVDRDDVRVSELRRGVGRGVEAILRPPVHTRRDLQCQRSLLRVTGQVDDGPGWSQQQALVAEFARQLPPRVELARAHHSTVMLKDGLSTTTAPPANAAVSV